MESDPYAWIRRRIPRSIQISLCSVCPLARYGVCLCQVFADYVVFLLLRSTMKSQVSHELTIPEQTRYLVSIDLGRVERLVRRFPCSEAYTLANDYGYV